MKQHTPATRRTDAPAEVPLETPTWDELYAESERLREQLDQLTHERDHWQDEAVRLARMARKGQRLEEAASRLVAGARLGVGGASVSARTLGELADALGDPL